MPGQILYLVSLALILIMVIYVTEQRYKKKPKFIMTLEFENIKIKGEILMIGMKVSQKVKVTLQPKNRLGNPASVEPGSVVFESSDLDICTVVQNPDNELEAEVFSSTNNPGTAQLEFRADADLGEGVEQISGFSAVEILPLQAVRFGISVGIPEDV